MKYRVLIILIFLSHLSFGQTCIICVRTKDSLFIGADTRVANSYNNKYDTVCKIIKNNNFYYTFAGFSFEKSLIDFNKYFDSTKNIKQIASEFLSNRYPKLLSNLTDKWANQKEEYVKLYTNFIWAESMFFGVEKNKIVHYQAVFQIKSTSLEKPKIDTFLMSMDYSPSISPLFHCGGHCEAVDTSLTPSLWDNGIQKGIESLILKQSQKTPERVAFPIDMVLITSQKQIWLTSNGRCN